ncbi:MAG: LytR C-terminal domain-containing protein [Schaalia hyovaginalis]|uniref:LytR C-terminal domain-containing protein n=1 Tax=Schaalia hyovaginalis TaxID=29316 RepID=UPI002A91C171|nr:LytR C-terminal domain-containing protein [Schaalia hyovaginalis]MDY6213568.1 LytR C-terminal domain-containing protein [Schaalia hyovaginalis]
MSSKYPRDEFDIAGEDMPVGMHRPQASRWKNVWPFLVILVIVPLLAWGASTLLMNRQSGTVVSTPQSVPASRSAQSAQSAQSASSGQSEARVPEETQSSKPTAPEKTEPLIDYNVKISVLNGTGTQGLAAEKVSELAAAGFPGATAANADGWVTQASTVYYEDPALEASAQAIGEALGIANVQVTTGIGDPDVVVILR